MSLTLYELAHSPYCLPLKRILEAVGQPFSVEDVPNWDRSKVIEITGGAYYQVPVLVHEGKVLYESGPDTNDIAQYVDTHFVGSRLFPAEHQGLHEIIINYLDDEVEGASFRCCDAFYVDSIPDLTARVMVLRHKERKFGRGCIAQWRADIEALRHGAEAHFIHFDAALQRKPFLFGNQPVYADFLLWGILTNYTWQGWNQLPPAMPSLAEWYQRLKTFSFA